MRCLTLAMFMRDRGWACEFACMDITGNLISYVSQAGFRVHRLNPQDSSTEVKVISNGSTSMDYGAEDWIYDARQVKSILETNAYEVVIVDHYKLSADWESAIRPGCLWIMAIDDLADRNHICDLLLDHNAGRTPKDYAGKVSDSCRLVIGPPYALLRSEFARARLTSKKAACRKHGVHLLITVGGVDSSNIVSKILDALSTCSVPPFFKATVVLGVFTPWLEQVRDQAKLMPFPVRLLSNVTNMAQLMTECDAAIGAGGVTALERCCVGLPTLIIPLAENQRPGTDALETEGCAMKVVLSTTSFEKEIHRWVRLISSTTQLFEMRKACLFLVDGRGTERVFLQIDEVGRLASTRMRRMNAMDLGMVLNWRNHYNVRQYMLNKNIINRHEHDNWYYRKCAQTDCHLLIFEVNNQPSGFVNFSDLTTGGDCTWGFYLAPGSKPGLGKSFGVSVLNYAFSSLNIRRIVGFVLLNNIASIKFHENLGFDELTESSDNNASKEIALKGYVLSKNKWLKRFD